MASSSTNTNSSNSSSNESKQERGKWDPLVATPRPAFQTMAVTDKDLQAPFICDLLTARDGRLLMGDINNKMVKILSPANPSALTYVQLDGGVRRMARLSGHLVAVNTDIKVLFLLDTSAEEVKIKGRVPTARQYIGIIKGPDDVSMIAGCWKDDDGPARIDVISHDASVIITIASEETIPTLRTPTQLLLEAPDRLLVPDLLEDKIYIVQLSNASHIGTITHDDIKKPTQVLADGTGNLYFLSYEGQCVLVRSSSGKWRRLLEGRQHGVKGCTYPWAACLTDNGIVVSWNNNYATPFAVTAYTLE